jgi:hypothetical protein
LADRGVSPGLYGPQTTTAARTILRAQRAEDLKATSFAKRVNSKNIRVLDELCDLIFLRAPRASAWFALSADSKVGRDARAPTGRPANFSLTAPGLNMLR